MASGRKLGGVRNARAGHRIYGDSLELGLVLDWHEFSDERTGGWRWEVESGQIGLGLNFGGSAIIEGAADAREVSPDSVFVVGSNRGKVTVIRPNGPIHRFYLLIATVAAIRERLVGKEGEVDEGLRGLIGARDVATEWMRVAPMTTPLQALRGQLLRPPVPPAARSVWMEAKLREMMAHALFPAEESTELFCERHHRINRERCERVVFLLERDMENPPSLEMLAAEIGCSPFTLSRTFTQETGHSIPKALRKLRIERAAQLLRAGSSVTDAAMEVGYSSLGAFNKAFADLMGTSPGSYARRPFESQSSGLP